MNRIILLFLAVTTVFTFTQCKPYQPEGQGITGQVTWLEGNQMPTISESGKESQKEPKGKPVKRTIRIYPLLKISDMSMDDGLVKNLAAKPITEIESDETGKYSVQLSPGRYSVFTVEEGGLFANIFDGEGNVQPVTVKEGEWTLLDIVINYKAVY
jgi:hypothetical protein